jgi:hypothetical protein
VFSHALRSGRTLNLNQSVVSALPLRQVFGASMEHTPWYRFPFMRFVRMYMQVLYREVGVVVKRYGVGRALFSNAFVVDAIPGVVMALLMGQLQLLALPLRAIGGETYDDNEMVEELVVSVPKVAAAHGAAAVDTAAWRAFDPRIRAVRHVAASLYVLTVPTFKPFSGVVLNIARARDALAGARILLVSNQTEVQMKVCIPRAHGAMGAAGGDAEHAEYVCTLKTRMSELRGCEVLFEFTLPVDGTQQRPGTMVALAVTVPFLCGVVRALDELGMQVLQVYDFFS